MILDTVRTSQDHRLFVRIKLIQQLSQRLNTDCPILCFGFHLHLLRCLRFRFGVFVSYLFLQLQVLFEYCVLRLQRGGRVFPRLVGAIVGPELGLVRLLCRLHSLREETTTAPHSPLQERMLEVENEIQSNYSKFCNCTAFAFGPNRPSQRNATPAEFCDVVKFRETPQFCGSIRNLPSKNIDRVSQISQSPKTRAAAAGHGHKPQTTNTLIRDQQQQRQQRTGDNTFCVEVFTLTLYSVQAPFCLLVRHRLRSRMTSQRKIAFKKTAAGAGSNPQGSVYCVVW